MGRLKFDRFFPYIMFGPGSGLGLGLGLGLGSGSGFECAAPTDSSYAGRSNAAHRDTETDMCRELYTHACAHSLTRSPRSGALDVRVWP